MATIVLYPSPGIGHLISMVELGKLLLTQNPSHSITILIPTFPFITGSTSPYISSVSSAFPSISFHFLPSIPLSLGEASSYSDLEQIIYENARNNNSNVRQFLHSITNSSHVSAFILDFFCYPALEVAQSFHIPTYFFFTSGASALALFLNFPAFDKITNDSFRNLGNTMFEIPSLFSVPASHMVETMLDRGVTYREFVNMSAHMIKSDGIIVNSLVSLEPRAVKALQDGTCIEGTTIPHVYCIGPLIAERGGSEEKKGVERNECLSWLDLRPNGSVVYLGFGSRGLFSEKQIREIAFGLEKSGVRFLWIVRTPPNSEDKSYKFFNPPEPNLDELLPSGFLDRTKDHGLVVKSWAPQIDILAHEAVGGFVTHCGWNSTLEAVCAGVPIVAWPLYAEQKFNKILLVEELKIALPMNESEDGFVTSDEIEKRVKQIMSSEEGDTIRKKMMNLSHDAKVALNEGGSSKVALARFVESWK